MTNTPLSPGPGVPSPPNPLRCAARTSAAPTSLSRERGRPGSSSPLLRTGRGAGGEGRIRHGALIVFGALGGSVAWATHLIVVYALLPIACLNSSGAAIHLTTLLFGGMTVGAIVVSWRLRGRSDAGQAERWLATGSLLLNGLFLFAIVVEGAAAFVVDPCL